MACSISTTGARWPLHRDGLDPGEIGFEFRRLFLSSLRALATQAADGGPLAQVQAYSVTTLFHHRLPLLGFARLLQEISRSADVS